MRSGVVFEERIRTELRDYLYMYMESFLSVVGVRRRELEA
eukprot:CAMPEP_0173307424 /NCGR_PEP_ID=MMETSP1143-20121109/21147_1 /TAXON_ID=483371 /ORGANISM="non described non described, Strain CCMP2298" /LENGTH=39 /DNA_ID= /DNA_START= /DNA_END= /DNA_ORIENTATION=